jgi:hypothetical protein
MNPTQRPAVAAIAASLVNGQRYYRVYDHAAGQYLEIVVDTADGTVTAFDHGRSAQVRGAPKSVYDYGAGAHLQFDVDGATVKGFDYGSGQHFQATITDKRVDLFDYQAGAYFIFEVA